MSTLRCNAIQDTAGVERYLARAWVNFNGTGTVAIRAAGNVASITDNATGNYTVNFTNAMQDANYAVQVSNRGIGRNAHPLTFAAGSVQIENVDDNTTYPGGRFDSDTVCVTVYR